jgi:signal recognition particle subunit SRP54
MEAGFSKGAIDFNMMLQSFKMMKKMGSMKNVMKLIPGLTAQLPEEALDQVDDKQIGRTEAIILSMTYKERTNPDIINGSRRKRIAAGSGTSVEEVNHLIKQMYEMRRGMKQMSKMQQRFGKLQKRR